MRSKIKKFLYQVLKRIWNDIENAKWAIILIIAYFVLLKILAGTRCPVVAVTGYPCPACGLTRAFVRLLHLDFVGAFKMHAFIYIVIIYLLAFFWNRYVKGKKAGRKLYAFAIIIVVGMIGYYIWRMLRYFPGNPPMSYYYHNLSHIIKYFVAEH